MIDVYFDLDGVLADFDGMYKELFGDSYSVSVTDPAIKAEKWAKVATYPSFFRDLPLLDGAMSLWESAAAYSRKILSAATKHIPASEPQKREWAKDILAIEGVDRVIIVIGKHNKTAYCKPGDVLIDDHPENIESWNNAGGKGILFLNAEQAGKELHEYMATLSV